MQAIVGNQYKFQDELHTLIQISDDGLRCSISGDDSGLYSVITMKFFQDHFTAITEEAQEEQVSTAMKISDKQEILASEGCNYFIDTLNQLIFVNDVNHATTNITKMSKQEFMSFLGFK